MTSLEPISSTDEPRASRALPVASSALCLAWARTRLFECWIGLWSVPFAALIPTWFQLTRRPRQVQAALRWWSVGFILGARWILGVRWRLEGLRHRPDGPVLFVANHQSYWESIAFTAAVPGLNVVSKRGALAIPVFGWGLRHAPMSIVDRDRPGRNLRRITDEVRRSVEAGRSVLLFPEGTRVRPGEHLAHQRGLEWLYASAGVPLVPVVHDAGLVWPRGFAIKRPGTITVRLLRPVPPGEEPAGVAREVERLLNREKDELAGIGDRCRRSTTTA